MSTSWFSETFKTLLYALLIAGVVRTVAYEPFNIPSESMVPGLLVGDFLFVSKRSYGYGMYSAPFTLPALKNRLFFTEPKPGDVVVFRLPKNPKIAYIKRLIGRPGDTIQVKDGVLHINGQPVKKEALPPYEYKDKEGFPYLVPHYRETLPNGVAYVTIEADGDTNGADNTDEYTVPPGHYFMMGDNRDRSQDSRFQDEVGFVPKENLVGKAKIVVLSMGCNAKLWQVWRCPAAFRSDRFLTKIQ